MGKVEIRKDFPFGAYNVARNLLDLIDATSQRGPYLFFVSSWGKYFENGKTDDLGSLRTFFIRMHRDADAAIPVTLDVQKAITCDIEPNIRGGPTWIVFHVDEGPLMWPDNADDYDEDGPYDRAFKEYQANAEKYCRYLLDTLAERLVQDNELISDNPRPKLLVRQGSIDG
jgi:hypothetical protein